MTTVSVVKWQPTGWLMVQADRLRPKVGSHRATWRCAAFIAWTGWTLAMF